MSTSGLFLLMTTGLVLLALAALKKLAVNEIAGWITPLSQWLVRVAASRLPRQQKRYEEEWLSEIAAYGERRLSGLRYAIGLLRGARDMGTALEDGATGGVASPASEIVAATRRAADPERAARVIKRLVETSRAHDWSWAELLAELRAALTSTDIDHEIGEIEQVHEEFVDAMRRSEPYEEWRAQDRLRELASPPPGLSGPSWWRRR